MKPIAIRRNLWKYLSALIFLVIVMLAYALLKNNVRDVQQFNFQRDEDHELIKALHQETLQTFEDSNVNQRRFKGELIELCSSNQIENKKESKQMVQEIVIMEISKILFDMEAPFHLSSGSVLNLVRSCNVSAPDIDFDVDYEWLEKNKDKFLARVGELGYRKTRELPNKKERTPGEWAMEFTIENPVHKEYLNQIKTGGAYADIFGMKKFADDVICTPLWTNEGVLKAECAKFHHSQEYIWNGGKISLPEPFVPYLVSKYGVDWMIPKGGGYNLISLEDALNGNFIFADAPFYEHIWKFILDLKKFLKKK